MAEICFIFGHYFFGLLSLFNVHAQIHTVHHDMPPNFFLNFFLFFFKTPTKTWIGKKKTLHFLCIKNMYILYVHYMYTICILNVYCMFTYQVPTQNWACVKKISNGTLQDTVICFIKNRPKKLAQKPWSVHYSSVRPKPLFWFRPETET